MFWAEGTESQEWVPDGVAWAGCGVVGRVLAKRARSLEGKRSEWRRAETRNGVIQLQRQKQWGDVKGRDQGLQGVLEEKEESFSILLSNFLKPGMGRGTCGEEAASKPVTMETGLQLPSSPGERRASQPPQPGQRSLQKAGGGGGPRGGAERPPTPYLAQSAKVRN